VDPLRTPDEHLDALAGVCRAWVERLLRRAAPSKELIDGEPRSRYQVAAAEAVRLLDAAAPAGAGAAAAAGDDRADALWREIEAAADPTLPFPHLVRAFGLDPIEARIVAALAVAEHDVDIERLYTFAWDDFTRKRADVGFLVDLIGGDDRNQREHVRRALAAGAPLRRWRLLLAGTAADADMVPPRRRLCRLADRAIAHLGGDGALDPALDGIATWVEPAALTDLVMAEDTVALARRALALATDPRRRVLLRGPGGVGKGLLTRVLATEARRPVLRVDVAELARGIDRVDGRPDGLVDRLARAGRDAALRDGVVLLHGGATEVSPALAERLGELVRDLPAPVVYTAHAHPGWLVHAVPSLVDVTIAPPPMRARVELWRRAFEDGRAVIEPVALTEIAGRFSFGGASIRRAAERAITQARLRDPGSPHVGIDDLTASARLMLQHRLGSVARQIPPGFGWDDLVLPEDTLEVIREILDFARNRAWLLEEWGFERKLPYGRGVSAVMSGPPGTGKTMVAQLLARELGYDLYLIELAQVVNKYIGETEKNLARVFDEAEGSHAVLFFDEADALFAKRTEVRSSNDRYANLEVNYLLQRMETYNGITLLATNLEQGLDEAFKRRVRFHVQFDLPEPPVRRLLWRSMFPPEVPLADDIDWNRLAQRWEMAGGYIKKAVLRAAGRARARGADAVVTGEDLELAAQQEYREMGRVA